MITAIIPARKSDSNLENKNILSFADGNLLTHKIAKLNECELVNEIVVSTDCEMIGEIAHCSGAKVVMRPKNLSALDTDFNQFCRYVSTIIETPHVLWAPVTCPLVTSKVFDDAVNKYYKVIHDGFDSLISVNRIKRYLLDNNGPLNFRFHKSNRQEDLLPDLYEYVNAISICSVADMKSWHYNWGKIPFKYQLPVSMQIDICDKYDYELARLVYEANVELFS